MDLLEYQARDLFERFAVPVLSGKVATTPDEAVARVLEAREQLQVGGELGHLGGRDAAGGGSGLGEAELLPTRGGDPGGADGGRGAHAV